MITIDTLPEILTKLASFAKGVFTDLDQTLFDNLIEILESNKLKLGRMLIKELGDALYPVIMLADNDDNFLKGNVSSIFAPCNDLVHRQLMKDLEDEEMLRNWSKEKGINERKLMAIYARVLLNIRDVRVIQDLGSRFGKNELSEAMKEAYQNGEFKGAGGKYCWSLLHELYIKMRGEAYARSSKITDKELIAKIELVLNRENLSARLKRVFTEALKVALDYKQAIDQKNEQAQRFARDAEKKRLIEEVSKIISRINENKELEASVSSQSLTGLVIGMSRLFNTNASESEKEKLVELFSSIYSEATKRKILESSSEKVPLPLDNRFEILVRYTLNRALFQVCIENDCRHKAKDFKEKFEAIAKANPSVASHLMLQVVSFLQKAVTQDNDSIDLLEARLEIIANQNQLDTTLLAPLVATVTDCFTSMGLDKNKRLTFSIQQAGQVADAVASFQVELEQAAKRDQMLMMPPRISDDEHKRTKSAFNNLISESKPVVSVAPAVIARTMYCMVRNSKVESASAIECNDEQKIKAATFSLCYRHSLAVHKGVTKGSFVSSAIKNEGADLHPVAALGEIYRVVRPACQITTTAIVSEKKGQITIADNLIAIKDQALFKLSQMAQGNKWFGLSASMKKAWQTARDQIANAKSAESIADAINNFKTDIQPKGLFAGVRAWFRNVDSGKVEKECQSLAVAISNNNKAPATPIPVSPHAARQPAATNNTGKAVQFQPVFGLGTPGHSPHQSNDSLEYVRGAITKQDYSVNGDDKGKECLSMSPY